MKKYIIIAVIVIVIIIAGYTLYSMMTSPMYEVGNVSKKVSSEGLIVPEQKTENTWEVEGGIFLRYFKEGEGKPVLIIHGGPGIPYATPWSGLNKLTDGYEFYYYDQRGSGDSTRPITKFESDNYYENALLAEETLGITAQLTDIERIRQILGEEKLTIIGHSYGGFLATLYAAEFPDNVEALVLVTPATVLKMPSDIPGLFDSLEKSFEGEELEEYNSFVTEYFDFKNTFSYDDAYYTKQNEQLGEYFYKALKDKNLSVAESKRPGGLMIKSIYLSCGICTRNRCK